MCQPTPPSRPNPVPSLGARGMSPVSKNCSDALKLQTGLALAREEPPLWVLLWLLRFTPGGFPPCPPDPTPWSGVRAGKLQHPSAEAHRSTFLSCVPRPPFLTESRYFLQPLAQALGMSEGQVWPRRCFIKSWYRGFFLGTRHRS